MKWKGTETHRTTSSKPNMVETEKFKPMWEYPYTIYVNVLLSDGKIVGWKTGQTHWSTVQRALCNRQYLTLLLNEEEAGKKLTVQSACLVCNNSEDNNFVFTVFSEQFYRKYPMHPGIIGKMLLPY